MSAPAPVYIGVDPGARTTGIVVTQGTRVIADPILIQRAGRINQRTIVDRGYIEDVLRAIADVLSCLGRPFPVIAVEGVNSPSPALGMTNAGALISTGVVLGAILGMFPGAVVVPPGQHGSKPMSAYPRVLVGPRESAAGTGRLRHCRSAYDVALAGKLLVRIRRAFVKAMCPRCLAPVEDLDGFGVLVHDECGFCSHPDVYGDECRACGRTVAR